MDNTVQAKATPSSVTVWDAGYPSGGNYWSDYAGVDLFKGPGQDISGSDEIGDTHYVIDANNRDNYPLLNPCTADTNAASLVVRGSDDVIYYWTYSVASDSWNGWTALPGATGDRPAARATVR